MTLTGIKAAILAADYDRALLDLTTLSLPEEAPYLGYWYQGICYLLQGDEDTAQGIWFSTMMDLPEEMAEAATLSLCELLDEVATYRAFENKAQEAWLIRQYIAEINPDYFNNRFALLELDDRLGFLENLADRGEELLNGLQEQETFNAAPLSIAYSLIIFEVHEELRDLLEGGTYLDFLLGFVADYPQEKECLKQAFVEFIVRRLGDNDRCLEIAEILEGWSQGDFPRLSVVIPFYHSVDCYEKAIVTSEHFLAAADRLEDKIAGYYLLLQSLLKSGAYFDRFKALHPEYLHLILTLLEQPEISDSNTVNNLIIFLTFLSYLQDNPAENNHLKRLVSQRFTQLIQDNFAAQLLAAKFNECPEAEETPEPTASDSSSVEVKENLIRIGYISECLRRHSIGYLVRDLFKHHDRSKFEIIAYTFDYTKDAIQSELINSGQTLKIIENQDPVFIYN
ncbi:MAG: hypothetical protein ACO3NK_11500 [Prochlorotrichaceae cyanobacterium]